MEIPENLETLIFNIDHFTFGVNVEEIIQVIESAQIQQVPEMPDCVQGITNFRDKCLSVINLTKIFRLYEWNLLSNLSQSVESVVIVKSKMGELGIQIGQIEKIAKLPIKLIEPLPKIIQSVIRINSIWGLGLISDESCESGKIITLVHLHKLLTDEQIATVRLFEKNLNST